MDERMATTQRKKRNEYKRDSADTENDEQKKSLEVGNTAEQSPASRQLVARVKLLHTRHAGITNVYNIPADRDEQWDFFFEMLQTVNDITRTDVRQSILRSWCAEQRKSYMKTLGVLDIGVRSNWGTGYLTRKRKEQLDSAGFPWGHLKTVDNDDIVFSENFQTTVRQMYKDSTLTQGYQAIAKRNAKLYMEHGVTDVPIIRGDTMAQKKIISEMLSDSTLKSTKRYNLEGNEILSDPKVKGRVKKTIIPWSQRIKDLRTFAEEHDHCNVPLDFDGGLGRWVKRQKNNKKLSARNQMVLEDLGFEFHFK